IGQVPRLATLIVPAALVCAAAGAVAAVAALRRRPDWLVGALAAGTLPMMLIVLRAEVLAEPLFSWRPVAGALAATVPRDTEIVFEAPQEYQLVGGLAYYVGRPITLLEADGFVPPAYLARVDGMFLPRDVFERRWRAGE